MVLKWNTDILLNYNGINPQIIQKDHEVNSGNNMELQQLKQMPLINCKMPNKHILFKQK